MEVAVIARGGSRSPKDRLAAWFEERSGRDRFDDIHVDEIHPSFAHRDRWLEAAVESLRAAIEVARDRGLSLLPAAGFSLRSHATPAGVNFDRFEDLIRELDVSPPSICAFTPGDEPWVTEPEFRPLGAEYVPQAEPGWAAFFTEWYHADDGEFRRSFWLAPKTTQRL